MEGQRIALEAHFIAELSLRLNYVGMSDIGQN